MVYQNPPFLFPELAIYGEATLTQGLEVRGAILPLSLLLFGLIWECGDIWAGQSDPTNTWSPVTGTVSTSWSATGASLSTSWTVVTSGEC